MSVGWLKEISKNPIHVLSFPVLKMIFPWSHPLIFFKKNLSLPITLILGWKKPQWWELSLTWWIWQYFCLTKTSLQDEIILIQHCLKSLFMLMRALLTEWKSMSRLLVNVNWRSSLPGVFFKKGDLRNFANFTGKHLCQSLFFK